MILRSLLRSALAGFVIVSAFSADADVFDDRAQIAAERTRQARAEARRRGTAQGNRIILAHMRRSFAKNMRAAMTDAQCRDFSAYPKYTYPFCDGVSCVNVSTGHTTELDGSPLQGVAIRYCRVNLTNGLACAVAVGFVINANDRIDMYRRRMTAQCYDAAGNLKDYDFGVFKM